MKPPFELAASADSSRPISSTGASAGFSPVVRRSASLVRGTLVTAALALSLAACATTRDATSDTVRLGPGDQVRLVPAEQGFPANDHPVGIGAEALRAVLGSLRVRAGQSALLGDTSRTADSPSIPLFTDENLRQASVALEHAFAAASPQQDVALRLSQLRSSDLVGFLRSSRVTTARLFHREGRLNLIFGAVDLDQERESVIKGAGTPKISGNVGVDSTLNILSEIGYRNNARRIDWHPVLPAGVRMVANNRNDWIQIDPNMIAAASRPSDRNATPSVEALEDAASALSPGAAGKPPPTDSVEQQLRQLRSFYDQGLISEELYREKARELVERLIDSPPQ